MPTGASEEPLAIDEPLTIREWARAVWESANQGDHGALEGYLSKIPEPPDNEQAQRLRAALDQHNDNLQTALANRTDARAEAHERMVAEMTEGEISKALTSAVEVQTLSDDLEATLDDPRIADVVNRARAEIPPARREGDWLYAYELLYRLNVLYEHTDEFEDELARVNQRLTLLTHYSPRRLHELRQRQADRFGEEPLGEFNAALVEDWRERVDGINHRMVKRALETAAEHHIEDDGWRPLLRGGLEGLRTVATTPALAETFNTLRDAEKVNRWLDFVDQELERLERTPDGDLGYWKCSRLLDALVDESEESIGLPNQVIYRRRVHGDHLAQQAAAVPAVHPRELRRRRHPDPARREARDPGRQPPGGHARLLLRRQARGPHHQGGRRVHRGLEPQ
jgi:hypothetical protein